MDPSLKMGFRWVSTLLAGALISASLAAGPPWVPWTMCDLGRNSVPFQVRASRFPVWDLGARPWHDE